MADTFDFSRIECGVCYEPLLERKPRNLRCGHSFCEECLKALLKKRAGSISCPTCREDTPADNVDSLPLNWVLVQAAADLPSTPKAGPISAQFENYEPTPQFTFVVTLHNGKTITVRNGTIVEDTAEALVSSTDKKVHHSRGVAKAIMDVAGPVVETELSRIKGLNPGEAFHTTAGNLPNKGLIHACGPHYKEKNHNELLTLTVTNCLDIATKFHWKSIAFPAIGTGSFQWPKVRKLKHLVLV